MKKSTNGKMILVACLSLAGLAGVAGAAVSHVAPSVLTNAADNQLYHHYKGKAATFASKGYKEYWMPCYGDVSSRAPLFAAPSSSNVVDVDADPEGMDAWADDDSRWVEEVAAPYGYSIATGAAGKQSGTNDRIVLEIPGASAGETYLINDLKFKVMNGQGGPISGNGTWCRRILLGYSDSEPDVDAGFTYSLPGLDALGGSNHASQISWAASSYDPALNDDGTYDLPSASEEVSWNKGKAVTAHAIGDTGKVGVALLLADFSAGEMVGVTSFAYTKAVASYTTVAARESGAESASTSRIVLEIPNALDGETYWIDDLKFKVMNVDGTKVSGNGAWERRLILTQTASTAESASSTYALPGLDKLSDTQNAHDAAPWTPSAYDSTLNDDGTYDLPSPDEELSWSKGKSVTAHAIGDTGKIGVCLLLRDFSAKETVVVTSFKASRALIGNGDGDPNNTSQTWSYPGLSLSANTAYTVNVSFRVMTADGGDISGSGLWGRRIAFGNTTGSNLYWLSDDASLASAGGPSSYKVDGVATLPTSDVVMDYSFQETTDADGKFPIYLLDFKAGEQVVFTNVTASPVAA